MAILNSEEEGVYRLLSDSQPTHCTLTIESFSLITEYHGVNGYESEEFKAGGYRWKLVMYPNGNKKKNVEDHISVYLRIAGEDSLQIGWGVSVDFRLFLLDQNKGVYVVLEDAFSRQKCLHWAMRDVGFDKAIPLEEFRDASNGYLIDDKCVFGAEVFVRKERKTGQAEIISKIKSPCMYKHVWQINDFSMLKAPIYQSEPFNVGGHNWIIVMYPRGNREGKDSHVSLHLGLADKQTTPAVKKVYAEYSLHIVNQRKTRHQFGSAKRCFVTGGDYYGWNEFIPQSKLSGLMQNDGFSVEAEITVLGTAKEPPSEDTTTAKEGLLLSEFLKKAVSNPVIYLSLSTLVVLTIKSLLQ